MATITDAELAELIQETGHRHHAAFIDSDGVDAEWPLFYAGYLQAKLWDRLGVVLTRSELVYVLVGADKAFKAGEESGDWPPVYARHLRAHANAKASG